MNEWVRRSLSAGALTAGAVGAVVATGAAAYADTTLISNDNVGILNGTQVYAPIQAPINLCGVAAAVAGEALAGCEGGSAASIKDLYDVTMISKDNTGVLNGSQVFMPVQFPLNVCGISASIFGVAAAKCDGGASATMGNSDSGAHYKKPKASLVKSESRTQSRTQSRTESASEEEANPCQACPQPQPPQQQPPVQQPPVQQPPMLQPPASPVCPPVHHNPGSPGHYPVHHYGSDVAMISKDNVGILNGTQVYAPVQAPINVSSVSAAVVGQALSHSDGGASSSF